MLVFLSVPFYPIQNLVPGNDVAHIQSRRFPPQLNLSGNPLKDNTQRPVFEVVLNPVGLTVEAHSTRPSCIPFLLNGEREP